MSDAVIRRHAVSLSGSGEQTLVFAHGFGCEQTVWSGIAPAFELGYRVLLFDHAGAGRSDPQLYNPERHQSLYAYAEDVVAMLRGLRLRRTLFVGHSVSGMIALLAAKLAPELFDKVVAIAASPRYIDDPPDYRGGYTREEIAELLHMMDRNFVAFAQFFAPLAMKNADRPELSLDFAQRLSANDPTIACSFARAVFLSDHRADLPDVTVRTMIVECADDDVVPSCVGAYLHAHLPDSSRHALAATGHCPHISHPRQTIALLHELLPT